MVKKIPITLSVLVGFCLMLLGCTNKDTTSTKPNSNSSSGPTHEIKLAKGFNDANFDNTVVYEDENLKIRAQGLFTNGDNQAAISLMVTNKTRHELDIESDNMIINNYLISTSFDKQVEPLVTGQFYLITSNNEHNTLIEANIKDIRSIKLNFEVDIDTREEYETGWTDEIKTNKYPLEDTEPSLSGTSILEDDNIKIIGLGIPQKTKDIPEYFNLACMNASDKDLEFEVEVISINNIDTDDFDFDVDLPAHTKYVGGIKLFPEDLKKFGIQNSVLINEIVLQAKVKDGDKTVAQGEEHTFAYNVNKENE